MSHLQIDHSENRARRYLVVRALPFLLTAQLFTGCGPRANLDAVKSFASTAQSAQSVSDAMASDIYTDCVIAREHGPIASLGTTGIAPAAALYSAPLVGDIPALPTPDPKSGKTPIVRLSTRPQNQDLVPDSSCIGAKTVGSAWKAYNDGVFAYAKAVAQVAGVSTAPNATSFKTLGDNLAKTGLLPSTSIGELAGSFIAGLGNLVVANERDHDVQALVAASQKDDVFQQMIDIAQAESIDYQIVLENDIHVVDEYYVTLIGLETQRLDQLLHDDGEDVSPSAIPDLNAKTRLDAFTKKCLSDRDWQALRPAQRRKAVSCREHTDRDYQIAEIRDRITDQREKWTAIDQQIMTGLARVQPYYSVMGTLGAANKAIVKPARPGLAGIVDALAPFTDELSSSATALVTASPSSAPKPTAHASATASPRATIAPHAKPTSHPASSQNVNQQS